MKDQRLSSDDECEPVDLDAAYKAAADKWLREVEETIAEVRRDQAAGRGPKEHLISVDELRAAGALDFPPGWRESLRVERTLFSGLFTEEHFEDVQKESTRAGADDDESGTEAA